MGHYFGWVGVGEKVFWVGGKKYFFVQMKKRPV